MLFTLVLNHRNGIQECLELLSEFQCLFYNINDYKKHEEILNSIKLDKNNDESYKLVIESVHSEFNIEYPMIKEIAFRESVEYSYVIQQVNQIFIEKKIDQDTHKFISNETMKRESHKKNVKPLNGKFLFIKFVYSQKFSLLQVDPLFH